MPVKLPPNLPAIEILKKEHIFVTSDPDASPQDIHPLKILILNLMPLKIDTETDIIRLLSNTPLHIEVQLLGLETHIPKNTPIEHLRSFYKTFPEVKDHHYDGFIVTGAPIELLPFEAVNYWPELTAIFDWARGHAASTCYICWAGQAALYHFYGIEKHPLERKIFGVFPHTVNDRSFPLFRGFDDRFYAPHSRHTTLRAEEIARVSELTILSQSEEAGVYIVASRGGRELYVTGHSEYAPLTLHNEYRRDLAKGLDTVQLPVNYYPDDDPTREPLVLWRSHANLLFVNWLNYFVNQSAPYDPEKTGISGHL